jgi:glycosyltransferase involved in cell wall biosynthesis
LTRSFEKHYEHDNERTRYRIELTGDEDEGMTTKDRPLRITILSENRIYPRDVRVKPHAECLRDAGYEVTVISPGVKGYARRETLDGIQIYRFPFFQAKDSAISYLIEYATAAVCLTVLSLWVWIRHGMDVLLVYNPPDLAFVLGLIPKLLGKTVVFDVRDISPELYQAKFLKPKSFILRLLVWMENLSCRVADHVITVNESYRRLLQQRNGIPDDRINIIRQGPDLNLMSPTQPDEDLRGRAGTILAYLGNMSRQDGVEHLLYALHELDTSYGHTDWFCVLIGGVDDPDILNGLAREMGLTDKLWFAGYLPFDQWLPLLSTADICIEPAPANPLNSLSTMNKIMDYMALSKPCVAYDLPEHRVTAEDSALYAEPNQPEELARQIAYLMQHPAERGRLGSMGRRRVEQTLALSHQKKRLLELFAHLARRNKHGVERQTSILKR